jgi:hypothetical protein
MTLAAGAFPLTRLVAGNLPPPERCAMLRRLVVRLAREERQTELAEAMPEALSAIAALPHAEERAAAYTGLGRELIQIGSRTEGARTLAMARLAAHAIATQDFYDASEAIASVAAMLVPQDGFFIDAAHALNEIGQMLATAGLTHEADAAFAEARQELTNVEDAKRREDALSTIGKLPAGERASEPTTTTTTKPVDLLGLARAGRVADATTELEQRLRARTSAQTSRDRALCVLANSFANLGDASPALAISKAISGVSERARSLLGCVQSATGLADRVGAERAFTAMIETAACEVSYRRRGLLAELFLGLVRAGLSAEPEQVLALIPDVDSNSADLTLHDLVKALTAERRFDQAEEVLRLIHEPLWQEPAARLMAQSRAQMVKPSALIRDHVHAGRVAEAAELARAIPNDYERFQALAELGVALARADEVEEARGVAAEIPDAIGHDHLRRAIAIQIADALARRGQFTDALATARAVDFDWDRVRAFAKLAPFFTKADHHADAEGLLFEGLTLVPSTDEFLHKKARVELLGILIEAASAAILIEPTLLAAAELEKHEHVEEPDKWNPAGQIMMYERRQEADQAYTTRTEALRALGAALIAAERPEDAERVASALREPDLQAATRRDGALQLVQKRCFARALAALGLQDLDQWIQALATWAPAIEEIELGLYRTVLVNVVRIVAWVRSDWAEIKSVIN